MSDMIFPLISEIPKEINSFLQASVDLRMTVHLDIELKQNQVFFIPLSAKQSKPNNLCFNKPWGILHRLK